ncbi:Hydroquinone glucosyltransferase [Morus notabilis]|uniref:Glycosyltransferase n=1 Tax=Morus notabilis TaxID=981085 RepID=W9RY72_9ROSA|nr:hydroquinone glucosyltransferase [Morus notabilis]EXC02932.1 Hydroquinone glucosyltransferase [Morus notabilis]
MEKSSTFRSQDQKPPHVAIFPSPGMGHLIPVVELAKRLVVHHNINVTFIVPNDGSTMEPQKKLLQALPKPMISSIFLPQMSFDDLPADSVNETRIALSVTRSVPALRQSLKALTESTRLVALVVDMFCLDAFDVAKEFNVLPYMFTFYNALVLSLAFHLPKLDETTTCEYKDLPKPVKLPGCVPVHGRDLGDPAQDRKHTIYKVLLNISKRSYEAAGIIVNSFLDLEPGALKALKEGFYNNPPVYPVGPVVQTGSSSSDPCLSWLDKQPKGSVLFVSFGSGGTLSQDQMTELALGLEMSGARFFWVAKSPHEKTAARFFSVESNEDPFDYLPKGFLERTKDVGLVVSTWAPQVQVLSHGSTGGFLSHCGWNSALESIVHGVPLIAWPSYAEQRTNAVLLADDVKVAIRVKVNDKGLVGREEISGRVRELMEGELEGKLIRARVKELKDKACLALSKEGSSTKSLAEIAQVWVNNCQP